MDTWIRQLSARSGLSIHHLKAVTGLKCNLDSSRKHQFRIEHFAIWESELDILFDLRLHIKL